MKNKMLSTLLSGLAAAVLIACGSAETNQTADTTVPDTETITESQPESTEEPDSTGESETTEETEEGNPVPDKYYDATRRKVEKAFQGEKVSSFNISGLTEENSCLELYNPGYTETDSLIITVGSYHYGLLHFDGTDIVSGLGIDDAGALRTIKESDTEIYIEQGSMTSGDPLIGVKEGSDIYGASLGTISTIIETENSNKYEEDGVTFVEEYGRYDTPDYFRAYQELKDGEYLLVSVEFPADLEWAKASVKKILSHITLYNQAGYESRDGGFYSGVTGLDGSEADLTSYANIADVTSIAILNAYGLNVGNSAYLVSYENGKGKTHRTIDGYRPSQFFELYDTALPDEDEYPLDILDSKTIEGINFDMMGFLPDTAALDLYVALEGTRQLRFFIVDMDSERDPAEKLYEAAGILLKSTPEFFTGQSGTPNYGKIN